MVLSLLIGFIAGLRTFTPPAAVSWATRLGTLELAATPLAFLGYAFTPWVLTAMALGELVYDKLPTTTSRKLPGPFGARIVSGGLSGAAIGLSAGAAGVGLLGGIVGAVIGTLGGYAFRMRLAKAFGRDWPAALVEDAVAIGGALVIMMALR